MFWKEFDAIELHTCVADVTSPRVDGRRDVWPITGLSDVRDGDRFECYTVYGHFTGGGVRDIADCHSIEDARAIAAAIAKATGLRVYDHAIEWKPVQR